MLTVHRDLIGLAHVAAVEPYGMLYLGQLSWVGRVLVQILRNLS